MADNNPKPPPKPPTRPLEDRGKDLESEDRLQHFEIQNLMSREADDGIGADVTANFDGFALDEDPDAGGEIFMPADDGGEIFMPADDGGEVVGDFGEGAVMPPRAVTMTAEDLGVAEDPDAGGEIAMPADDGGEVVADVILDAEAVFETLPAEPTPNLIDDLAFDQAEPTQNLTDLELATDFDEATHTFDTE
jgi:hypothetical protein